MPSTQKKKHSSYSQIVKAKFATVLPLFSLSVDRNSHGIQLPKKTRYQYVCLMSNQMKIELNLQMQQMQKCAAKSRLFRMFS